jgi:Domain of unknown function (DUF6867)
MEALLGTSNLVFIGFLKLLWCGAAIKTGHAIADTWRPLSHCIIYGCFLGAADRLLGYLLAGGGLLSVTGYLLDTAVLILLTLLAYRATQAHKMTSQYPWLYERSGPFGWRERTR